MTENAYRWTSLGLQTAMLLVAAGIALLVERETAKEDVAAAYVDIAASILMAPATEETAETGMRCWALKLLIEYSPRGAPIPDKLRKALLEGKVVGAYMHFPEGYFPQDYFGGTITDPECEL